MSATQTSDEASTTEEHHETHITIVVNGQKKTVPSRTVSWDEVVDLAYPGERGDENFTFVVTYSDAQHSKSGILEKGGSVEAKEEGTSFNVAKHRRS
jgi:ribosomal protein S4